MVKRALLAVFLTTLGTSLLQARSLLKGNPFYVPLPAGTVVHCRITQTLTTKLDYQGDAFAAQVSEPVLLNGREVIPVGATVEGRIAQMDRPGRIKGVGKMRLTPERITLPDGRSFPMSAIVLAAYGADGAEVDGNEGTIKGASSRAQDAQEIAGGGAIGAVVGLIASHPLTGAVIGGTVGLVDRLRRRGKDLTLPAGTQLDYQLTQPLEVFQAATPAGAAHPSSGAGE
jgi:hypothetical protein